MKYLLKLGQADPYYIAKWDGDPGRTYLKSSARRFASIESAERHFKKLIKQYPQRYNAGTVYEVIAEGK